jgi:hypothetical protein
MLDLSNLGVTGQIWHMDPTNIFEAQLEGEDGRIVVERSDHDEVSVHFMLEGDDQAVSSLFMNVNGAHALMGLLHIASHGAFSLAPTKTPDA